MLIVDADSGVLYSTSRGTAIVKMSTYGQLLASRDLTLTVADALSLSDDKSSIIVVGRFSGAAKIVLSTNDLTVLHAS